MSTNNNNGASSEHKKHIPFSWPCELTENEKKVYGLTAYRLIAYPYKWIHRRVESVDFAQSDARRHTSVDFTIPKNIIETLRKSSSDDVFNYVWVPIALLKKRVLADLDVRDEREGSVPVLVQRDKEAVTIEAMSILAEKTLLKIKANTSFDEDEKTILRQVLSLVISQEPQKAKETHQKIIKEQLTGLYQALCIRFYKDKSEKLLDEKTLQKFFTKFVLLLNDTRHKVFKNALKDLVENYFFFVSVRTSHERRIIKYSYIMKNRPHKTGSGPLVTFKEKLIWWKSEQGILLPRVDSCASLHVEIIPPPEYNIERVVLQPEKQNEEKEPDPIVIDQDNYPSFEKSGVKADFYPRRINIHLPNQLKDKARIGEEALLIIAPSQSIVSKMFLWSLLGLITLLVNILFFQTIVRNEEVHAMVTLIVLTMNLPNLYWVRSEEHPATYKFLFGLRLGLSLSIVAFWGLAIMLMLHYESVFLWCLLLIDYALTLFLFCWPYVQESLRRASL